MFVVCVVHGCPNKSYLTKLIVCYFLFEVLFKHPTIFFLIAQYNKPKWDDRRTQKFCYGIFKLYKCLAKLLCGFLTLINQVRKFALFL